MIEHNNNKITIAMNLENILIMLGRLWWWFMLWVGGRIICRPPPFATFIPQERIRFIFVSAQAQAIMTAFPQLPKRKSEFPQSQQ